MAEEMSKSAKRRAAKKARDMAAEEAPAPPPAVAPPTSKAKAAASAPAGYPVAKAKAKADSKAPAPEPAPPAPKAKAKSKAAAAEPPPPPAPEPKAKGKAKAAQPPPAPEPAPKAAAKSKAGAKSKPEPKEEPKAEKTEIIQPYELDDGTGDWELSTGLTKRQQKQKDKKEEEKRQEIMAKQAGSAGNKKIAGFNAEAGGVAMNLIPGMAQPGAKSKAQSQSVNAGFAGVQAQIAADKARMEKESQAASAEGEKSKEQLASATVHVDEKKIGIIIGPGGKRIKELTAKSGVTNIDTSNEIFTITGPAHAVEICRQAIEDLNTKGYTGLLYDDFADDTIMVPTTVLPEIIGKKGVCIIKLKDELGVEVNISDTGGKKSKVTIAGSKANAQKARQCIEEIMKYYHSEVTHPGVTHEEMEIEPYQYAFIIGKAGSEMRHIQKNYNVKVYIPRAGESLNENVLIVGEPKDVIRAKAYIEKVLWNSENNVRGRDRNDKADDHWGDEGEEEPWMKQYLYKRTYK